MIDAIAIDVNRWIVADEFMQINIAPEQALEPIALPADMQPALTYLAGLGKSSQRPQWAALCRVAAILTAGRLSPLTLPWQALRRQHVNAVRAYLVDHYAVATGDRYLTALRGVLKECWRLELMSIEQYHRAIDVKPIRGSKPSQAAGRALAEGEIAALIAVCRADASPAGPRDAAILGLAVRCGLRRAEIAGLELADYDAEGGALTVRGKGRKTRLIYLAPGVDTAIGDWLHYRGRADGRLFCAVNKGGRLCSAEMSDTAIYLALSKRGQAAGLRKFSPHDLRRTYAGDLLDAGADIATVKDLMGHASANTTAGYDRRGERTKRSAAGRLFLPWPKRFED